MINLVYKTGGVKRCRPIRTLDECIQACNTPENIENWNLYRQTGDDKYKRELVQVNYNCQVPEGGLLKSIKTVSPFFFYDIDCGDRDECRRIINQLLRMKDELGLLEVSESASYGVHAVARRQPETTILENQVRISMMTHTEMDTNNKENNRVVFHGPIDAETTPLLDEALFTESLSDEEAEAEYQRLKEREQQGLEEVPAGAKKANKHYRPWEEDTQGTAPQSTASCAQADQSPSVGSSYDPEAMYNGLPYKDIIAKWWEMYNEGKEPVKNNRDVLTFELAVNLRHICGFDRELMDAVIPCYDQFPQAQKMKCIDSALAEKRTQMPKRLKDVLFEVRRDRMSQTDHSADDGKGLDEAVQEDERFYYNRLPKMPQGVKDSIEAVGPALSMPVVTAICPAIGMLATGVQLDIHGVKNTLNLISYITGDFASGKGKIDPVIAAWMSEVAALDKMYTQQEDEWRAKKLAAKNKKDQPEEPKLPVRFLTLNNTVANLAERLANTDGKHAFSFTPEADTVAQKWKSSMSDFSVMLRQSYDGSRYDREARSAEAVNVHIDHLLWNVTMCGTPDALYRVVSNYTDGFQSRIAVASTPDNTFTKLEDTPYVLTDRQAERIRQIAHLLPLMQGEVTLSRLEQHGREWVEQVRLETMKNDDKVKARQRFRICVTAQRMTCCIMLCKVAEQLIAKHGYSGAEKHLMAHPNAWKALLQKAQTPTLLDVYDVVADYLMETALFYFRERIENAFNSRDYAVGNDRQRMGKNDSIFARLDVEFGFEGALQHSVAVKGANVSRNQVRQMLKNWKKQGLIIQTEAGRYRKVQEMCH